MCFHYNQMSHKKVDCPMFRGGVVIAPAPVTLRITDGRGGRAGSSSARSRASQCQSGESKVSSDVVAGMLSYVFFMPYYECSYIIAIES